MYIILKHECRHADNLSNSHNFKKDVLDLDMHLTLNLGKILISELNHYSRVANGCSSFALVLNSSGALCHHNDEKNDHQIHDPLPHKDREKMYLLFFLPKIKIVSHFGTPQVW